MPALANAATLKHGQAMVLSAAKPVPPQPQASPAGQPIPPAPLAWVSWSGCAAAAMPPSTDSRQNTWAHSSRRVKNLRQPAKGAVRVGGQGGGGRPARRPWRSGAEGPGSSAAAAATAHARHAQAPIKPHMHCSLQSAVAAAAAAVWRRNCPRRRGGPQACKRAAVPCCHLPGHRCTLLADAPGPPAGSQLASRGGAVQGGLPALCTRPNEFATCPMRGVTRRGASLASLRGLSFVRFGPPKPSRRSGRQLRDCLRPPADQPCLLAEHEFAELA